MAYRKLQYDPNRPYCSDCDRWMSRTRGKAQSGRQRYKCFGCGRSTTGGPESTHDSQNLGYNPAVARARLLDLRSAVANGANRFVITSAVNNTELNTPAWKSLLRLCADRKAHLIVVPIHYKNVTLYNAAEEFEKWWSPAILPYLIDEEVRIGPKTWVRADISIQATAADPLSGMAPLANDKWAIFGHSQQSLEPIPTPIDQLPGRMYTTGAITKPSYSKTKLGAKAAFHHVCGALLVETQGGKAFIRQLNFDHHGRVQDLCDLYSPTDQRRNQSIMSLTTGDEHVKWMLPGVLKATYTKEDSLVATCRPEYIVRHDVLDGYAGSHHHLGNHVIEYRKWLKKDADYRAELDQVVQHINETTPAGAVTVIIQDSNHHDHLHRWLERADDRKDHQNADLICELRNEQRKAVRENRDPNPFKLYLEPRLTVPTIFVAPHEPFMLAGVDHSQHGHRGVNGSRGSARALANTTHKLTIGHAHSARIVRGVFQVGKSCGTLEYEGGLSSHTHTHCLMYPNGKRTLVDVFARHWRATNSPKAGKLKISADFD